MNAVSKANGIVAIRLKKAIKDKGIKTDSYCRKDTNDCPRTK